MSLLNSLFTFILIIAIAGFCILNAQAINITWSPIHDTIELPLYAVILGGLIIGFVLGALSLWINNGSLRKTKRQQKKHIKTLEKELSQNAGNITNQQPPNDFFPALTYKKES